MLESLRSQLANLKTLYLESTALTGHYRFVEAAPSLEHLCFEGFLTDIWEVPASCRISYGSTNGVS
jgi:hypothetical protein